MPKQAIVQQNAIEIKKRLLGGIALHFNCPVCNEGLETNEADAIAGETCPTCSTRLLFDAAITDQIKQRILKKQEQQKEKEREKSATAEAQQQQKLERAERVQQEQMINEAKEEQWREDQKKKKIEQAKKKNSPTIGQRLAFILGFLFVLFSYFIPVFGTMTLVTGGIFMVCSLLSEIATHLVRLKIALEENKSE